MTMPVNPEKFSKTAEHDAPAPPSKPTEMKRLASSIPRHLSAGIAVLAADHTVVSWTPQVERITGFTVQEVKASGFVSLFEPAAVMRHLVEQGQRGIATERTRVQLRHADGGKVYVDVQCSPLYHTGERRGDVAVVISGLSPLESSPEHLRESERLQSLGELAGPVSHEMHNPLTTIFLHSDILEEELRQLQGGSREQLLQALGVIKEEVTRMYELADQYLALARLSMLPREPEELGAFLQEFALQTQERLAARHTVLRLEGVGERGSVAIHARTFRRALLNLLDQALDNMPQGGTVTLRAQRTTADVQLELCDSGGGMQPEELSQLLRPTISMQAGRVGLGLYWVREVIAAHDGALEITSEPGSGTTFTVRLPLWTATGSSAG